MLSHQLEISMSGYSHRAVVAPSKLKAARLVAAQIDIRRPLLRHAACNFLKRANFPVPPGPPTKWNTFSVMSSQFESLNSIIECIMLSKAICYSSLFGWVVFNYPAADLVLLEHQVASRQILLRQVLLVPH